MKPSCTRHGGQPEGVKGESVVRPSFNPELTDIASKTPRQRLTAYRIKRLAQTTSGGFMDSLAREMNRVGALMESINQNFAAVAEDQMDWERRLWVITVDEGGRTIYAASLELDSPALEAKLRLVREELEQMTVAALSGLEMVA